MFGAARVQDLGHLGSMGLPSFRFLAHGFRLSGLELRCRIQDFEHVLKNEQMKQLGQHAETIF